MLYTSIYPMTLRLPNSAGEWRWVCLKYHETGLIGQNPCTGTPLRHRNPYRCEHTMRPALLEINGAAELNHRQRQRILAPLSSEGGFLRRSATSGRDSKIPAILDGFLAFSVRECNRRRRCRRSDGPGWHIDPEFLLFRKSKPDSVTEIRHRTSSPPRDLTGPIRCARLFCLVSISEATKRPTARSS